MNFYRPVDDKFPVCADFLEWGERYEWLLDPVTGFWVPRGSAPGTQGQHQGVDFDCLPGTVVSAMADGMIVKAQYENAIHNDLGPGLNIIQIVQMMGYDAWWIKYSHLRRVYVNVGERIKRGQGLGETGQTGNAIRPMLHVDLRDPLRQYHPPPWQL